MKRIPGKYRSSQPLSVARQSPLKLRKQVELFATYFRREFDYAIREFDARDKDPYTAYLFPDQTEIHTWESVAVEDEALPADTVSSQVEGLQRCLAGCKAGEIRILRLDGGNLRKCGRCE